MFIIKIVTQSADSKKAKIFLFTNPKTAIDERRICRTRLLEISPEAKFYDEPLRGGSGYFGAPVRILSE